MNKKVVPAEKRHTKTMSTLAGKKNNKGRIKRGKRVGRRWTPEA